MQMNLQYELKTIRKTVAYGEVCLSASIWHGKRQVGSFYDCADTGKPIFDFDDANERHAFEEHVQAWWFNSDYVELCNLHSRELIEKNLAHDLPMNTKMRCWISMKAGPMSVDVTWKWPSREAKHVIHSFQSISRIGNR